MSRDEDHSALQPTPASPAQGSGLASRRWAMVMLVLGLVLGVLGGQLAALYRPDLLVWMVKPHDTPVVAPPAAPVNPPEPRAAYGSGLKNPADLADSRLRSADLRLVMRIQELSERIESLPSQFNRPALPDAPGQSPATGWMQSLSQTLSGLFLIRRLSDSERFQLDATGYELAKRQIEQRLLAARLSIQMGERELAQIDLSQATLLMTRTLDPRSPEVLKAVAEVQTIGDLLGQSP